MKSFFEEYGFVILAAIVVIILIAMATPLGGLVKSQITNIVDSFSNKTQSKLNATDGIINVRASTANNKITLEWDANKKEDEFKYQYKASNTSKDANWTTITEVPTGSDKSRKIEITTDSNNQPLANKTKVEYKIYDSNDQLVASGVVTAKVGKNATTGGEGGVSGGSTETTPTETLKAGTKLTIEGKEYTVIEQVEGNKYKVLANELANNGIDMKFDENRSNNYANSTIADYLDGDYYNRLPESIKKAIVEISIKQKLATSVSWNNGNNLTWGSEKEAGTHKVFLPSWDELTKAAGGTDAGTLNTFFNNDLRMCIWLRDTYDSHVLSVGASPFLGNLGQANPDYLQPTSVNPRICVRPAFVLDLSGVDYTVNE